MKPVTGWISPKWRDLLCSIFLWALPLFALTWIWIETERETGKRLFAESRGELVQVIAHYQKLSQPHVRLTDLVKRIVVAVEHGADCSGIGPRLSRKGLDLFLFNQAGNRLLVPGFSREFVAISQRILGVIRKISQDAAFSPGISEGKMIEGFLDDQEAAKFLAESQGCILDLAGVGSLKFAGWFEIGKGGGFLLARIDSARISQRKVIQSACKKMRLISGKLFEFGWVHLGGPSAPGFQETEKFPLNLRQELIVDRLDQQFMWGGRLFVTATLENGVRLFVSRPEPVLPPVFRQGKEAILVLGFVLFLISVWLNFFSAFSPTIRFQLVFLFGIAGVGGIILLLGFNLNYLTTRRETQFRQNREMAIRLLQKTDDDFQDFLEESCQKYRRYLKTWEKSLAVNPGALNPPWVEDRNTPVLMMFIADGCGKILKYHAAPFTLGNLTHWGYFNKSALSAVVKLGTARFNKASPEEEEKIKSESGTKVDYLIEERSRELPRSHLKMAQTLFQGKMSNFFSGFACLPDGKAVGLLNVTLDTRKMAEFFLLRMRKKILSIGRKSGQRWQLLAIPKLGNTGVKTFPAIREYESDVTRLHERISQNGVFASENCLFKGKSSLISGISGHFLWDYNLFLVAPFSPIRLELEQLSNRYYFLAFLSAGFAVFLGFFISVSLLDPLNELTSGITRLAGSQFSQPVMVTTGDELEALGNGIVKVMAEMQELQVAKAIQEQLFPSKCLAGDGWSLHGWTRSPSEIGGELFDYLVSDQGSVVFYVAHVSGGNISSALEMAMTKAALRIFLNLQILDPVRLLEEFQVRFGSVLPYKKKLEICLGIFEPQNRQLTSIWIGKGKIVICGGASAEHKSIPLPAATGEINDLWEHHVGIQSGTRVVAFSSGVLVAENSDRERWNEGDLVRTLEETLHVPIDGLGPALFNLIDKKSGKILPEGGQTLVVLETA